MCISQNQRLRERIQKWKRLLLANLNYTWNIKHITSLLTMESQNFVLYSQHGVKLWNPGECIQGRKGDRERNASKFEVSGRSTVRIEFLFKIMVSESYDLQMFKLPGTDSTAKC
jgi:hypothetical protein